MKKGINVWAFTTGPKGRLRNPLELMEEANALGYECIEFNVEEKGPVSLEMTEEDAKQLKREADEVGIELLTLASGIAWSVSPTDPDPKVRKKAVENYEKILDIASWLGVKTVLYIPGMVSAPFVPKYKPQPYEEVDKRARQSLKSLIPAAKKRNVKIGVENVWNRFLLSPPEMKAFIDSFKSSYVGSYFDVGNVMLYGHPEHWIQTLGKRIFAVHIKDFKVDVGNAQGFVEILKGDVDFPAVIKALKKIGYNGPLTAEVFPIKPYILERTINAMEKIGTM